MFESKMPTVQCFLCFGYALFALSLAVTTGPRCVYAQSVSIPPVPMSASYPFLSEVAGRAAVADGMYALTATPRLSVSAKWRVLTQDERLRVTTRTGVETLTVDTPANRVALVSTTESSPNVPQTVARFIANGNVLLGTQFTAPAPPKKGTASSAPARTFFQIPIGGDVETATEALILAKANEAPLTRVARMALFGSLENGGYGWRGRGRYVARPDGTVSETLPIDGNDRRTVTTIRRYRFDRTKRLPLSIEEWVVNENRAQKTKRTVYRQESFTYAAYPTRTDVFTTKPAPGYTETSPPSGVELPLPPAPDEADAKARALLLRWNRAWARLTAYNARVAVAAQTLAQTPESRPIPPDQATQEGAFTLYLRRPGYLYVAAEPTPQATTEERGGNRRRAALTTAQTAVSDGKTLAVYEGKTKRGEGAINGDDAQIGQMLRRNGFEDRGAALTWLFDGPPSVFGNAEFAEYRGTLPLPGNRGSAEAVTVRQTFTQNGVRRRQRGGRGGGGSTVETTIYSTIFFDSATGLPLRIERYINTTNQAALQRDNPPNRYISADYNAVRINEEASPGIFVLP